MVNNTPESKIDGAVKNALKDFEAPYEPGDWARMDSMLNATPKTNTINWKSTLSIVAGVAILGVSIVLYKQFSSGSKNTNEVNSTIPENNTTTPINIPTPTTTVKTVETPKETTPLIEEKSTAEAPKVEEKKIETETVSIKTKESLEKEKNKTLVTKSKKEKEKESVKVHPVIKMGNEPIFGDMLDSSKGVIGNTKEKEETKNAAKTQSNKNIGWDNFMFSNVNPDSIRKHREAMKKDTLKN